MRHLRIGYRLVLLSLVVSAGSLFTIIFQSGSMPPTGLRSRVTRWWHSGIARSLGISIRVYGTPRKDNTLFISNHISSFDIAAVGSILPVHFLSKQEVKHWPVIGWLATRAGTIYIPRGGKDAAVNANQNMAEILERDHNVLLFAEGTTTDGTVKRFHSRLVQSAVDSNSHVQPVAIRYPDPSGGLTHPAALYIEDMSFGETFNRMLSATDLVVEIYFGEAISAENKSRTELARHAESEVRKLLNQH